tara:strand:- start:431 stop:814 length:384 start_codon:yes stop_codon:yes gene_type:complete
MMQDNDKVQNDYEKSRDTYYDLIDKGKDALDMMMEVARESEHPRAFEVLSGLMKNIADVNDKVMDLNKKHKDINKEETKQVENQTTNNMFIGSTADLQKMLQQANKPTEIKNNVIDITPRLNDDEQH